MQSYLEKHAFSESLVKEFPAHDLKVIVIIPSYHEPGLLDSIQSILSCKPISGRVEIIPVLNSRETDDKEVHAFHNIQFQALQELSKANSDRNFTLRAIAPLELPEKIAGVGLARKIGMDEAVRRFEVLGRDGIILNFDADCICSSNYLEAVTNCFANRPEIEALSIGFKHRWVQLDELQKQAIILYELHLKTYIGWQKWYKYPYAYQTLGSCFAVRSKAYQAQGGMNKRKAGEDFYFLHKYSSISRLGELNEILVYPSGRTSHRVPFGTGKGVHDIIHSSEKFTTYNPEAIRVFCNFMMDVKDSYNEFKQGNSFTDLVSQKSLLNFLTGNSFENILSTAIKNCSDGRSFQNRISKWFDPFRLMKYLHYACEYEFPDVDVSVAARSLLENHMKDSMNRAFNNESLLNLLNEITYPKK